MLNFNLFFENHLKIFLPEIYIITVVLFLLLVGVIFSNLRKYKYPFFVQEMSVLTILTLFFTLLLVYNSSLNNIVVFNNSLSAVFTNISSIFFFITDFNNLIS